MAVLRLEVDNYVDHGKWRWVLKDAEGTYLHDHKVDLDRSEPKYEALFNLPAYLGHYASPDKRDEDERRLIHEFGAWMGSEVLGESIGEKILASQAPPIIVEVLIPTEAERLLLLPLDVAHARGRPLALSGVRMVFVVRGEAPPPAAPVEDSLRLLALFSLPPAGSPLNLRRERQMLRTLVRRLAGSRGLAVELRILQYGVTRDSLREALEDGDGWDIIHFSGHGQPGTLVLETADGALDLISSTEVSELLHLTGQRLKMVVLSACLSAAGSIRQTLAQIGEGGMAGQHDIAQPDSQMSDVEAFKPAPAVARALCTKLDCAALAMRYPVEDEFATALAGAVYEGLLVKRQSLPQALQLGLVKALGSGAPAGSVTAAGGLSLATPALFGTRAVNLKLVAPRGSGALPAVSFAYFPDEPAHFVGRVSAMTRASATLALEGRNSGVLFHGMAGAGKTSCAVELAYHHAAAQRFQSFAWYEAPKSGDDIALALRDLAVAFERQIPGLTMVHVVDQAEKFRTWLPQLAELLENYAVLIVLDNLESLLTEAGDWRDERWALLMDALLKPGGLSRVILTSRVRPRRLPSAEVIAIHALPLNEAVLLMRELPNMRRLLGGNREDRELVRRTMRLVQGHPKLINLAEGLAADPARLAARLDSAESVQAPGELDSFFRTGETGFDPAEFTRTLREWTNGIAGAMTPAARTCFHFLCAVEEEDRERFVLEINWGDVWKRLGSPEPVPPLEEALAPLVEAGLAEKQTSDFADDMFTVSIHPAVAEAGREEAGPAFQALVDDELARTWVTMMKRANDDYGKESGAGSLIARAGLAAFPYLSRLGNWTAARIMLARASRVDSSPAAIAAMLPRARRIAEATDGTEDRLESCRLVARFLRMAGRNAEAESLLDEIITQAAAREDFRLASAAAGELAFLLSATGRLTSALQLMARKADFANREGSGPWTRLSDEGLKLQILNQLGKSREVLARVAELRDEMNGLSEAPAQSEGFEPWSVRESLLDAGRSAALFQKEWQQALDFTAEISRSEQNRGAPILEQAMTQFNNYGPLLQLERYEEAYNLLIHCREVFQDHNEISALGKVQSALASLEIRYGRPKEAVAFEESALRLSYILDDPRAVVVSHFNVSGYIMVSNQDLAAFFAHRLASACLCLLTGHGDTDSDLESLAKHFMRMGPAGREALPKNYDELCNILERMEGIRFREMVARLSAGEITGDELLQRVIAAISEPPGEPPKADG